MSSNTIRRLLPILLLAYLLCAAVLFSVSILSFAPKQVLPAMFWRWVAVDTAVRFIDILIPVHCAAVVLAYSLLFSMREMRRGNTYLFAEIIRGPIVLFMLLLGGYVLLQEAALPRLEQARGNMLRRTELARRFLSIAEEAERQGRYEEAERNLRVYLEIDPGNDAARAMNERIVRGAAKEHDRNGESAEVAAPFATMSERTDMSAAELYDAALEFRRREDPFSAQYYAILASQVDGAWTEPKRLAAELRKDIEKRTAASDTDAQALLFARKKEAYDILIRGNDPVGAYYRFLELSRDFPDDEEVKKNTEESRRKAARVSFFRDEVERVEHIPGGNGVTFLNGRTEDGFGIFSADRMIRFRDHIWFIGIRAVKITDGEVRFLFSAPYGKLIGGSLVMHCIDREDRGVSWRPEYRVRNGEPEFPDILPLVPSEAELAVLAYARAPLGEADAVSLWRASRLFGRYGLNEKEIERELVRRLLLPFSFVTLSLLSALAGFRLRNRYLVPRVLLPIFLVPILPFVCIRLFHLIQFAQHLILGTVLAFGGFPAAVGVLVTMQAVLLLLALFLAAGQRV